MARFFAVAIAIFVILTPASLAAPPDPQGLDFFEKKIRPVLVDHCYSCHSQDAKKVRGGLLLDSRDGLLKGGDSGPAIVAGTPAKSLLLRALRQTDELRMPPKGKLPDSVVDDFAQWIQMGAPDPRQPAAQAPRRSAFAITDADRNHWSFRPVADPQPPTVKDVHWATSSIDRFILAKLEAKGFKPAAPADRHALIRRATFDLTGLPPTPDQIDAFLKDESPEAFAHVVDRLLASRGFGERWGRHWLDGVRYATNIDKSGQYRDWVVRALNSDMPYDQFIRLQIAADLIPAEAADASRVHVSGAALDDLPATGMLALAVWELVARDLAVAEIVDSQIDVVSRQMLGVTLACARCHDHKFDPFSNEDYFAVAGIFFSSHISPGKLVADGRLSAEVVDIPMLSKADAAVAKRVDAEIAVVQKEIDAMEAKIGPAARLFKLRADLKKLPTDMSKATAAAKTEHEKRLAQLRSEERKLLDDKARNGWREDPPELGDLVLLQSKIADLETTKASPTGAIGIQDGGVPGSNRERIGDAPIYIRGDHRKEGKVVPRRFPVIFAGDDQTPLGTRTQGSGRRELADWIASPDNPLTARVMVNRIWQHLFGQGLVRTPDNFGRLGEAPTHPELLDHLAKRFVTSGWSTKRLIRELMLSNTYQQASFADEEQIAADPENRLVGRRSRKRLEYEALRDSLLFVSGQLASDTTSARRRTLYETIDRKQADATRIVFDGADPLAIVPERATTTTTPQALFMLNNALVSETAAELAQRLTKDVNLKDDGARIAKAYLLLLGRPPSSEEAEIGVDYVGRSSWTHYLQVLLCTNEFLYLD
jgi:hypothetical protein